MKFLFRPFYRLLHDLFYWSIDYNPFFPKTVNGKKIKNGFIEDEHLSNPDLDLKLIEDLKNINVETFTYAINNDNFKEYLKTANYPKSYYGGGSDNSSNFKEKTLEHYLSTEFIHFYPEMTFIDIAACTSPFSEIVSQLYSVGASYQQDLIFEKGVNGHKIGGPASDIPLPDNSVDAVTLHCSLEHFENSSDIDLFKELFRLLKPGGVAVILPFYLAREYTIHIDPVFNFLKFHKPKIDINAQLRYCNWYQHHSRHYDVNALKERILDNVPELSLKVYSIINFNEIYKKSNLRFVGVFTKK